MLMTSTSLEIIRVVISSYTVVDCSRLTAVRAASTRRRRYWRPYAVVLYTGIATNGVLGRPIMTDWSPFCYLDIFGQPDLSEREWEDGLNLTRLCGDHTHPAS